MSDTPRNDEVANQTAGCSDALHFVSIDELSRKLEVELAAVTKRNGNLCVELAAVTQERRALRRGIAEMHDVLEAVYKRYQHLDWLRQQANLDPWHECVRDLLVAVAIALGYEQKAAKAGKEP